jgi:uroporphyrinogen-III synthase
LTVRLLLTRPERDAQRTAATLLGRGHTVIVAPMLRIEAIADVRIGAGPWAAILVTSANAADALAAHESRGALHKLPVFAVGERSALAMRDAGFGEVTSAAAGIDELARLVTERVQPGAALLYAAGEQRSGDLAGVLGRNRFAVETIVVYRAVAVGTLPQRAAEALAEGLDAVLHFSRRSAATFLNAASAAGMADAALKLAHFCLSAEVAAPLMQAGATTIRIAPRPAEAALLELIGADSA